MKKIIPSIVLIIMFASVITGCVDEPTIPAEEDENEHIDVTWDETNNGTTGKGWYHWKLYDGIYDTADDFIRGYERVLYVVLKVENNKYYIDGVEQSTTDKAITYGIHDGNTLGIDFDIHQGDYLWIYITD